MSHFASRAPWHHARKLTAFALSFLLAANSFPCLAQAAQASSVDKAETVYVYNNADGSVRQITSKIVLANDAQAESITDETALADIDSEQTFSADPNTGKLTWKTDGKEVQYQGTTDAQPPLAVHVTYTLDGAVVSPSQLAGKSGHLSMRYDFENTSWHGSLIDGSLTRVYTPFVAVASVTLPHSVFRNVSIENGKLTDGASSSMALGYALPGMQQSLDLSTDDADIPDHFVIEADVTDFELASVAIIVTPELLRDLDTSNLDTGELSDSMDALQDAVAALSEGSDTLTGALDQIADGEDQLVSGIDQFKEQTAAIPEATGALSSGASALADGVANAAAGATGLVEGTAAVRDAIDAVRTQALPLATEALDGAEKGLGAAQEALTALSASADTSASSIADTIAQLQDLLDQESEEHPLDDEQRTQIQAAIDTLTALETIDPAALATALEATATAVESAKLSVGGVDEALSQTSAAATTVADGAKALSDGLGAASEGASSLSSGIDQLDQSAPAIAQGLDALKSGASELSSALRQTADGSAQLTDGISQLKSEGIDELVKVLDGDLGNLQDRVDALGSAADSYDTFSGKADDMTGSVTFVYKVDAIEL